MVALVDVRRLTPRTDAVLADPRLVTAERRLGRGIVVAAVHPARSPMLRSRVCPRSRRR
jgi:L-seryl-tRNA(Ser) seleniumtransferase